MTSPTPAAERVSQVLAGALVVVTVLVVAVVGLVADGATGSAAPAPVAPVAPDGPDGSDGSDGSGGRSTQAPEEGGGGATRYVPAPEVTAEVQRLLDDFPFPAGARPSSNSLQDDSEFNRYREVDVDAATVRAFYEDALAAHGLTFDFDDAYGDELDTELRSPEFESIVGTLRLRKDLDVTSIAVQIVP